MSKITYVVKETKDDDTSTIIEKQGATVDFTINDLLNAEERMGKMLTETRGQMDYEIARMKNVEQYHEDAISLVKSLDPTKKEAIKIWLDAQGKINELGPLKDRILEALKTDQAELQEIVSQTELSLPEGYKPLDLNGTPSKETIEGDPVKEDDQESSEESSEETVETDGGSDPDSPESPEAK